MIPIDPRSLPVSPRRSTMPDLSGTQQRPPNARSSGTGYVMKNTILNRDYRLRFSRDRDSEMRHQCVLVVRHPWVRTMSHHRYNSPRLTPGTVYRLSYQGEAMDGRTAGECGPAPRGY